MNRIAAYRILYIAEDPLAIDVLSASLAGEGFAVAGAYTASDARRAALAHRPDAILCDLRLANESGLDALREIRSLDGVAELPVVLVAPAGAPVRRPAVEEALRLGATDIAFKPLEPVLVSEKLRLLLRTRNLARQRLGFISMLTQDLNGPIQSIVGFSRLLAKESYGPLAGDDMRAAVNAIGTAGDRLRRQIGQFLQFMRVESGGIAFDFQRGDLAALVRSALDAVQALPGNSAIETHFHADPGIPPIYCDRREVANALEELFRVSFENHRISDEPIRIRLRHDSERSRVLLDVRDEGPGYTAEQTRGFFDRHVNVSKPSSIRDGYGMGLPLMKAIVEGHGGTVAVESEVGVGTTFEIALPVRPPGCAPG